MSLTNIAQSGYFSSDRTIKEYANDIWKINPSVISSKGKIIRDKRDLESYLESPSHLLSKGVRKNSDILGLFIIFDIIYISICIVVRDITPNGLLSLHHLACLHILHVFLMDR